MLVGTTKFQCYCRNLRTTKIYFQQMFRRSEIAVGTQGSKYCSGMFSYLDHTIVMKPCIFLKNKIFLHIYSERRLRPNHLPKKIADHRF